MPRKLLPLALTLAMVTFAASCGTPRTNYYRLHYPIPESGPSSAAAGALAVERFRAGQLLRQDRIVYSTAEQQLNYYQYHRWADDPATMISQLVVRELASRHSFKDVLYGHPASEPDYTLRGRLIALEELDRSPTVSVRVVLEGELVKTKTGAVIWSGRAERERPVPRKEVPSVVEEMNQAVREAIGQLADAVTQAVSREGR